MTPTSDERREMAEQLRKHNGRYYEELVNMSDSDLADLIDPTCTVVSERAHTVGFGCEEAGTEFTLSCGHTVIVDGELPPRYCDECGARVVDEDGD